jgi:hypothetical protein
MARGEVVAVDPDLAVGVDPPGHPKITGKLYPPLLVVDPISGSDDHRASER